MKNKKLNFFQKIYFGWAWTIQNFNEWMYVITWHEGKQEKYYSTEIETVNRELFIMLNIDFPNIIEDHLY
jgi:hypothetical protein